MNIPCKYCLKLAICRQREQIKCEDLADFLDIQGFNQVKERYNAFFEVFGNRLVTGITNDIIYIYDVTHSVVFNGDNQYGT